MTKKIVPPKAGARRPTRSYKRKGRGINTPMTPSTIRTKEKLVQLETQIAELHTLVQVILSFLDSPTFDRKANKGAIPLMEFDESTQ